MENFIVSARKYRPVTFQTVVGQSHITTTLKNAIKNNHLAQAFLFCGPRGVGKTTCARILAKTINCENPTAQTEACNECESCKSFNESTSFNIFELDAASNNSVEDIRNLVDQVRIPPQSSRYKVYIIDEVHMLSQAAFNAFLKTLEEPPAYAKFILATTEKHKIIPTILSRCQIFDFKRIKNDDIANHLAYVAEQENVFSEPEALHIIAQKSDGGLRDALSMFDQLVSFTGGQLSYANIVENLNVLDYDYYFKVADALLKGDISSALLLYQDIMEKGFEGQHFITGFSSHLRDLLVCKDPITNKLMEVSDTIRIKYGEQASNCSLAFLLKALEIMDECDLQYKDANNKRLKVEITLIKIAGLQQHHAVPVQSHTTETVKEKTIAPVKPAELPKENMFVAQPEITATPVVEKKTPDKEENPPIKLPSSGTISINKPLADSSAGEKKNIVAENKILSREELIKHWNFFAENIQESRPNLYFALSQSEPEINEKNVIGFTVQNSLQEQEIEKIKHNLLQYLRENAGGVNCKLSITLVTETKEAKLYTPKDKYLFMSEKNPILNALRANLDLDIDF